MRKNVHISIATRLAIYVILMVITLFSIVMILTYSDVKKEIIEKSVSSTHIELKNIANQIGSKLSMVEVAVVNTAWMLEDNLHNHDSLCRILNSLVQNNPFIVGSSIAFEPHYYPEKGDHFMLDSYLNGDKVVCVEVDENKGIHYCGMNWYIIPKLLKQTYWNEAHFDEGSTDITISTFSYPLYNDQGEVYAVFLAKISLQHFTEWVNELAPFESSYSFLVNQHGYYLTHPKSIQIRNESIFSIALENNDSQYLEMGKEMIAGKTGTVHYDDFYALYTPVPNIGWSICNICPKHVITADVDKLFNTALIYSIVGAFLLFIILYVLIKKQHLPLKQFAKSAKEIAAGDFNTILPRITSKDEMLILYNSFEYMQTSLKKHIIELQEKTATNQRIENELNIARQKENSEMNLKLALEAGNLDAWSYDVKSKKSNPLCSSLKNRSFSLNKDNSMIHPDDISIKDDIINNIIKCNINHGQAILRYKTHVSQDEYRYYDTRMIAKKENNVVVSIAFAQKDITDNYLHNIEREYNQKRIEFTINSAELTLWEYTSANQTFTLYNNTIIGLDSVNKLSVDDYCKYLNADDSSDIEFRKIISYMNEGIDKSYSIDIKRTQKIKDVDKWMYCTIGGSTFEKDEDGRVIKYVGFIKDNTKWVTLNDTLIDLNTQLKTVLDVGHIYPFICDIKGNKFSFRAPDSDTPDLFIHSETELTWDQVKMVVHPEYREKMKHLIMSLINGDILTICEEIRYCTDSIHAHIYEINMSAVRDKEFKGQMILIGYLQDVTERTQMISELKKAKKEAEKSAKLKTAFLANMSHEIRTPLNAIIGFSGLLANETDEERKAEFIGIIATNNDLLLKLINDVLDLSKIDAGFIEITASSFDFSQFFNELHLSMQQRMINSVVKLSIIDPYNRCIVELDKNRIAQICINYITNAIKYTPKGFIDMGYEHVNDGLRIYVKDTGIGISNDKKHKLFQRFEKLDDFAQGTGLGLSITKALVESMNGKVGFESEKDSGSTFWAWIPCSSIVTDDEVEI